MFKFEIIVDPANDELDEEGEIKENTIEEPTEELINEMIVKLEDFMNQNWPRKHEGEYWGAQFTKIVK